MTNTRQTENELKTHTLKARVTKEQYDEIVRVCESEGLTISELLRQYVVAELSE